MTRARRLLAPRISRNAIGPFVLGFLVLVGGLGESKGLAQIGPLSKTSLEWMVVSADVVAKATVSEIAYGKPIRFSEVLDLFPVTVTLKVSTTWKGDPHETVQFCFEQFRETADMQNLTRLKATGQPALWFLRKTPARKQPLRTSKGPIERVQSSLPEPISWIELRSAKTELVIEGALSPRGVLSLNSHVFQLLEDEDKLVRAVQAELSRPHPKPFREMQFPIPNVLGGGATGDGTFLLVPVTPHLAELAQGWVTSKEDWVRLAGCARVRRIQVACERREPCQNAARPVLAHRAEPRQYRNTPLRSSRGRLEDSPGVESPFASRPNNSGTAAGESEKQRPLKASGHAHPKMRNYALNRTCVREGRRSAVTWCRERGRREGRRSERASSSLGCV